MSERPSRTFAVTFRAAPKVDAIRALRALLKTALRRFGLRCVEAREITGDPAPASDEEGQA